ncbi:MAG: hypothetical protein HYV97_18515 [Bdellovibrio sp.]|nr:hypothetical protein [Bdellovibrio sp.]
MKTFIVLLMAMMLSLQGIADEVAHVKEARGAQIGDVMKHHLVGHFIQELEGVIKNEVDEYNKNRTSGMLIQKSALRLDPQDAQYLLSLTQQTLPELIWKKSKYRAVLHGVEISFGAEDILYGQILIAGRPFHIDGNKPLSEIQSDLEAFMHAQKIVQGERPDPLFIRIVTSLFGISQAQAAIPLLVVAVLLLITTIGVGFWLKSKNAKLKAMKAALRQANQDLAAKADICEQGDSEAAYNSTFDLMASILAKKTEKSAAGAFYSTMLQPSAEGTQPVEDCRTMVNDFMDRTLGSSTSAAGDASEIGQLRTQLCGGSEHQQILSGEIGRVGSYVRLRNCLSEFYRTHRSITDNNRNSVWIDGDVGLVRNRSYYSDSVGR